MKIIVLLALALSLSSCANAPGERGFWGRMIGAIEGNGGERAA